MITKSLQEFKIRPENAQLSWRPSTELPSPIRKPKSEGLPGPLGLRQPGKAPGAMVHCGAMGIFGSPHRGLSPVATVCPMA